MATEKYKLTLRFEPNEIQRLADEYWSGKSQAEKEAENELINDIPERTRAQGFMSLEDFRKLSEWKATRIKNYFHSIDKIKSDEIENDIKEATETALKCKSERLRVGALRSLYGVDWPTASVFLHFCHSDKYPIIDYRALFSAGIRKSPGLPPKGIDISYTFGLWNRYVGFCRDLAVQTSLSMRIIDRALWQFSKDKEKLLKK